MKCTDCRTNMTGHIPEHLRNLGKCSTCYKIHTKKLEEEQAEKKKLEAEKKEKEIIEEKQNDKEVNIFDLLDLDD